MLNTIELKKYARLYLARKKIREKDKELTEQLAKMQDVLLAHMVTEEIDKFDFKGGITVSTKTLIWPKCLIKNDVGNGDRKAMIKALRQADLGYMVEEGFSVMTLAAYLRERDKAKEDLPKSFEGVIEANPVQTLTVKKYK